MSQHAAVMALCERCGRRGPDGLILCPQCVTAGQVAAARLVELLPELEITLTKQARLGIGVGVNSRSAGSAPLPFNAAASATRTLIELSLGFWLTTTGVPLAGLRAALPTFVRSDWAGQLVADLEDCVSKITLVIDRPARRWYAGPCDGCQTDLYFREDERQSTCEKCNRTHDLTSRQDRLLREARDYLVTATIASAALSQFGLELKVQRVYTWANRGKLRVWGYDGSRGARDDRGYPMYKLGEIEDLYYATQARRRM